jgi:hypothetical protein
LSVSPGSIVLGSYGQGYELADTIEVTASGAWTVSTDVDWLRFDTLYADKEMFNQYGDTVLTFSGSGNGSFTVKVFQNAGGPEREGTITVAAGGATATITIKQDWGAIEDKGIRYGRLNPNIPFDSYVGVIAKRSGDAGYSGEVNIPLTVGHNNRTYNVVYIHADAFRNCGDLTSVKIPTSVTKIDDYVFAGSGITSITIPNSVTEIGQGAFSGCTALTELTIPNSVTILGPYLCYGCTSLTSAKIPAPTHLYNVSSDGRDITGFNGTFSFWYCPLTTLEVGWDTPPNVLDYYYSDIWWDMFGGVIPMVESCSFNYANCTLIVPPGTVELYAAADMWKNFGANITAVSLSVSTNSLNFTGGPVTPETINVTSNTTWTASANVGWLKITQGDDSFTVTATRNGTNAERTGVITVSNLIGTATQIITVTQSGDDLQ